MAIHLVTGDDESLLRAATSSLVAELVGDGDRAMMVDEFEGEDYELRAVVDAAQTPPFLTEKRVVIARDMGRFSAEDLTGLFAYIENPLDTSDMVLVAGNGRLSPKLSPAVKKAGTVTATSIGNRRGDRESFARDRIAEAGLRLDGGAQSRVLDWVGEGSGQLDAMLSALAGAYEPGSKLGLAEVEPYLGEAGGLPPWDLTDAIDKGDTRGALLALNRMMHGGGRHPLALMATLHGHYSGVAKLDGANARSKADAEALTGWKGFRAEKALNVYRRLGGASTKRAIELLAEADVNLRGETDLEGDVVMEVLVARLSKLRR